MFLTRVLLFTTGYSSVTVSGQVTSYIIQFLRWLPSYPLGMFYHTVSQLSLDVYKHNAAEHREYNKQTLFKYTLVSVRIWSDSASCLH
jgi:hypothetical protein